MTTSSVEGDTPAAATTGAPPGVSRRVPFVVGVLSDTHGHLYPQVIKLLQGVDHIVHAGDIGSPEILRAMRLIAPVAAVRGNVDIGGWADTLPSRAELELGGVRIVVGHISPRPDGAERDGRPVVVVAGHSHVAATERRGDVLYLNPGSAGPRRFGRARTIARLEIWPPDAQGAVADGAAPRITAPGVAVPRVTAQIITVDDQ